MCMARDGSMPHDAFPCTPAANTYHIHTLIPDHPYIAVEPVGESGAGSIKKLHIRHPEAVASS